ncbi:MAG TPA: class I SAM-dependent methyltransferase [Gaiellaceae bacterium]
MHALLATLVAAKPGGRFAETGTAYGEGARAIAAAMDEDSTFVTVEVDSSRHRQAVEHLAGTRAEVVLGRWEDVLPARAPFDLVFADGGVREAGGIGVVIPLVAPGGFLVKDDMSPGRPIEGDEIREVMLRDERLIAVEVMTTATTAAIVAVRRSQAVWCR